MKLTGKNKIIGFSLLGTGIFLALNSLNVQAGTMGPTEVSGGNIYFGGFGGGGASTKVKINQYGSAYFADPLAVDAFGKSNNSRSFGMGGGQIGYQWTDILGSAFITNWSLTPAFEVEGYYVGKSDLNGQVANFNTTRLDEHNFNVSYPIDAAVFLINGVISFNSEGWGWFHPYLGAGLGGAVLSITGANSLQVAPPQPGVNHYNANPNDSDSAFAGQVKVGLNFAFSPHATVFAEYRWLYLAPSSYTFGSTVAPGHVATSAWQVDLGSQNYNMGAAGIRIII